MDNQDIPASVRTFLYDHFGSAQQLDVFFVLVHAAGQWLTAKDVAGKLNMRASAAEIRLISLGMKGLVETQEQTPRLYRYVEGRGDRDATIREIQSIYERQKGRLLDLIYTKSEWQIRNLSDAFIFKREDERG